MKEKLKITILGILLTSILVTLLPNITFAKDNDSIDAMDNMTLVSENNKLGLYINEEDTSIAVIDKESGNIWYSNPIDTDKDTVSTSYYLKQLKAQLRLSYINEDTQLSVMNNYTNCIEDGQFEIEKIEDGISIIYHIGDSAAFLTFPEVITEERMNMFLEKMDTSEAKKIKRNYTLNESNMYVLRTGVKDYIREEIAEYFEKAGYTYEDYELDSKNNSDNSDGDHVSFEVPLTYKLCDDSLVVEVDPEKISYNDNGIYLVNVDILPYFGASLNDNGYMFVPDGSGALIYFNNGKENESTYCTSVYGQDETFVYNSWYESQIDSDKSIKMPIFGIKDENMAFLAIIEEGDAYASINAEVSGITTAYNNEYASFSFLQYGETSLDDMVGANSYYMYSEPIFEGTYKIKYNFLNNSDANYSGMARCYQEYLIDKDILTETLENDDLPFFVEYIGAVEIPDTFLGIKYDSITTLTSFNQAVEITKRLVNDGVENIKAIYSGWMNDGLHGTAVTRLNTINKLESDGCSLDEFQNFFEEVGDLYFTLDMQYVYQDEINDGYSNSKYAPRYFDNTYIKINEYGLASRVSEGTLASLISPFYVDEIANNLKIKLDKKNVNGINLGTISWELFSDLATKTYTDRQMAKNKNIIAVENLIDDETSALGDNANVYMWKYVTSIVNVPLSSNNYRIIDEEIPFYEMVIHGFKQYAGESLNFTDDIESMVLKSVESGAGLNFKWIYESNSLLKDTEYDDLYSVNYEAWINKAIDYYNELNQKIGYLQNVRIVTHEKLEANLVKVTYEDGSEVYINYGQDDLEIEGIQVKARSFEVKRGDNK